MKTIKQIVLAGLIMTAGAFGQDPLVDFSTYTAASNLITFMNGAVKYQTYAGDPNGHLAGTAGKSVAFDSSNAHWYVCSSTGNTSGAVWDLVAVNLALVTNATQTKATVVPNTLPASGQILIGDVGGASYVPKDMSGAVTITSLGITSLAAKYNTWERDITLLDPVIGDSGRIQFKMPFAATVTSVSCSVKTASTAVPINLDIRAVATPDTAGTQVLTSNLACDPDSQATTSFSTAVLPADVPIAITIPASLTGVPDTLRIHIKGTIN